MKKRARTLLILGSAGAVVAATLGLTAARTPRARTGQAPIVIPVGPNVPDGPIGPVMPIAEAGKIQVAILLDTSGSMDGLIEQAKSQLWKVVNQLSRARRNGQPLTVEIALYEYGKSSLPAEAGFIRQILPFTTDLDRVSEELFALHTNGGDEYCGQAIQLATRELDWSTSKDDLKVIFIAGNEPFTQGGIDHRSAIAEARAKGIRVNTVHCGGDDPTWRDAAVLALGEYLTIDHNRAVAHIAAPQDAEIARLGVELNGTYVAYGRLGAAAMARQSAQDANAAEAAEGSLMQRSVSKASGAYRNSSWDLVDGLADGSIALDKLADDELPEELRGKSAAERQAYVDAKRAERAALQRRIVELNTEREQFVAAEQARLGHEGAATLDAALIKVVRDQGTTAGLTFE